MAQILWYFYGDIDCFMRGGWSQASTALADALANASQGAQAVIDQTGSAAYPPGVAGVVSDLIAASPNRQPGIPAWLEADWPLGWQVRFMDASQTGVDEVVIQPEVVSFKWPPVGGGGLSVNLGANVQPNLSDPHTIRYGNLLMQTVDYLVTTPVGRQSVITAADGGPINDVDLVALIKKTEPELASGPKALPSSFTAYIQEARQTTKTYLDVDPGGGVRLRLGFKEVPGAASNEILMAKYPCGGFVDPSLTQDAASYSDAG